MYFLPTFCGLLCCCFASCCEIVVCSLCDVCRFKWSGLLVVMGLSCPGRLPGGRGVAAWSHQCARLEGRHHLPGSHCQQLQAASPLAAVPWPEGRRGAGPPWVPGLRSAALVPLHLNVWLPSRLDEGSRDKLCVCPLCQCNNSASPWRRVPSGHHGVRPRGLCGHAQGLRRHRRLWRQHGRAELRWDAHIFRRCAETVWKVLCYAFSRFNKTTATSSAHISECNNLYLAFPLAPEFARELLTCV